MDKRAAKVATIALVGLLSIIVGVPIAILGMGLLVDYLSNLIGAGFTGAIVLTLIFITTWFIFYKEAKQHE